MTVGWTSVQEMTLESLYGRASRKEATRLAAIM
jgi:hypothetical protein